MKLTSRFSLRINEEERALLQMLAHKLLRSESGVVRWLIHKAAIDFGLLPAKPSSMTPRIYKNEKKDDE